MLFILLWKLVIADRVLAVLAEKAALQQTKRFLIGNRNFKIGRASCRERV